MKKLVLALVAGCAFVGLAACSDNKSQTTAPSNR